MSKISLSNGMKFINMNVFFVNQANNAYIFPGFGLGLIMSGTIRVHDDLLLAAGNAEEIQTFT